MKIRSWARTGGGPQAAATEAPVLCDEETGIFALADSMGDTPEGRAASKWFLDCVRHSIRTLQQRLQEVEGQGGDLRTEAIQLIPKLFQYASRRIYRGFQEINLPEGSGGTTGDLLAVVGRHGVIGHVGNARVYLIREGRIDRLTIDHTLAQALQSDSYLLEQDDLQEDHGHLLARSVGRLPTVRVDTLWVELRPNDLFLLCTDGFYRHLRAEELRQLAEEDPASLVDRGFELAVERGLSERAAAIAIQLTGEAAAVEELDTNTKIRALRSTFLFRYLDYQETVKVLRIVHEQRVGPGEVIVREGTRGDTLHLLVEGSVDVTKEGVKLTTIDEGGLFGEIAFVDGRPRSATVVANSDSTLLTVRREDFLALNQTESQLTNKLLWCFLQNVSNRLRCLSQDYVAGLEF